MAAGEKLKIDARRKKILDILARDGQVRVAQLSEALGTTVVTIRSDLAALERDGLLERMSGGAVQTVRNFYNLESQHRRQDNVVLKKSIAAAATELVNDGETLLINSGTTTFFTAIELKRRKNLNIVTNSVAIAIELGSHPTFRVILLGGEINAQYSFTYGTDAIAQLKKYKADKAILSVDGICGEAGLTTYHAEEAEIDKLMMERSRQTIIVADHTKMGKESFFNLGSVGSSLSWVTNECVKGEQLDKIRARGIEIIRC